MALMSKDFRAGLSKFWSGLKAAVGYMGMGYGNSGGGNAPYAGTDPGSDQQPGGRSRPNSQQQSREPQQVRRVVIVQRMSLAQFGNAITQALLQQGGFRQQLAALGRVFGIGLGQQGLGKMGLQQPRMMQPGMQPGMQQP